MQRRPPPARAPASDGPAARRRRRRPAAPSAWTRAMVARLSTISTGGIATRFSATGTPCSMVTTRCAGGAAAARRSSAGARVGAGVERAGPAPTGCARRSRPAPPPHGDDAQLGRQVAQRRQQPLALARAGRRGGHGRGVLEPGHLDDRLGDARRRQRRDHRLAGHADRSGPQRRPQEALGQPIAPLEDVAAQGAGGERDVAQLVERDRLGRRRWRRRPPRWHGGAARSETASAASTDVNGTTMRSMAGGGRLSPPPALRTAAPACGPSGDRG